MSKKAALHALPVEVGLVGQGVVDAGSVISKSLAFSLTIARHVKEHKRFLSQFLIKIGGGAN